MFTNEQLNAAGAYIRQCDKTYRYGSEELQEDNIAYLRHFSNRTFFDQIGANFPEAIKALVKVTTHYTATANATEAEKERTAANLIGNSSALSVLLAVANNQEYLEVIGMALEGIYNELKED